MNEEREFEKALRDLAGARDGAGLRVNLMPKENNAASLKDLTFRFLSHADPAAQYITLTPLGVNSSDAQEIAYWRNLALLANATAAAIEYESTSDKSSI